MDFGLKLGLIFFLCGFRSHAIILKKNVFCFNLPAFQSNLVKEKTFSALLSELYSMDLNKFQQKNVLYFRAQERNFPLSGNRVKTFLGSTYIVRAIRDTPHSSRCTSYSAPPPLEC